MAQTTGGTNVAISAKVNAELVQLKTELHAVGMSGAKNVDIVAALIRAARRSPIESVKAVIETHVAEEGKAKLAAQPEKSEAEG